MDFKNDNQHMVDVLFVLTLFFVFALSALTLVILGANVYRNTVNNMNDNFNDRTAYAYVTQKLRQNDQADSITIDNFDGQNACIIKEEVNGTIYNTYLYEYEGYLCELFARADMNLEPSSGTRIMKLSSFDITHIRSDLYEVKLITSSEHDMTFYINSHTSQEAFANE